MLKLHAVVEVACTGSIIASPGYLKLSYSTLLSEIYGFNFRDVW